MKISSIPSEQKTPAKRGLGSKIGSGVLITVLAISAYAWVDGTFYPRMTPQCAYLIAEHPIDQFSYITESERKQTLQCLIDEQRFHQSRWKIDPNYRS